MLKITFNRAPVCMLALITLATVSCKKYLEVETPSSEIEDKTVFSNEVTATTAVLGMYSQMLDNKGFMSGTPTSAPVLASLSSDELVNYPRTPAMLEFENNAITPTNASVEELWRTMYASIYQANSIIEGVEGSTGLTNAVRNQLIGEGLFIRSLCYFYLVNLYGEVPLVLTTDYRVNALLGRTAVATVYEQITADLESASQLLGEEYMNSPERLRPNKFAAYALLARIYLYRKNWLKAEEMATFVIDKKPMYLLTDSLQQVFLKNSTESIWQLQPVFNGNNSPTNEAVYFNPAGGTVLKHNVLRPGVRETFEVGDRRASVWIDFLTGSNGANIYFPRKYKKINDGKPTTEYSSVLRLAEQYLIRAEARVMQNKLLGDYGGEFDINQIRKRALLPPTSATTQQEILAAIEKERRIELIAEGGHRWFDLKRWGKATEVLAPLKGAAWQSNDVLYPLPQKELSTNPNLKPQNNGY